MRLCKPSFHVDPPLRLELADLIVGEDIFDDPIAASHLPSLTDSHVTKLTNSSNLRSIDPLSLHTLDLNHWRWQCRPTVAGGAMATGGQWKTWICGFGWVFLCSELHPKNGGGFCYCERCS
ncbi:trafficking protein particle complex subunit 13 [Fagus crenata]